MTDPLSVSASIAGLLTLADIVFCRTYEYVKAVKKAPKEISALSTEIGSLYGILSRLQLVSRQLEDEAFDTVTRIHHVHSCYQTLEQVKSILNRDDTSSLHAQRLETFRRKLRWPFTSLEVKNLIADIERHKATLGLALNVDCITGLLQALSRQDEVRSTVEGIRTELKERHEAETRIAIDKERQKILKSFAEVDPRSNHDMSRKLRSPGTGLWLTEGQEFKQWMETINAKLWFYGIPGAGKTVLASSVIEEALRISNPSTAVAFFYCDYKDPATQELSNILGSLAQQFAKQDEDSFTKLRDFHNAHNSEHQSNVKYESDALSTLVKEMTLGFDSALIIVDGLDECGRNASVAVDALAALNEVDDSTIKTIFFSRDEIDIRERLEGYTMVSIAARSSDLKLYVGAEIDIRMRKKRLRLKDQSLKEHILDRLVGGAEGMFRWVTCQMDYLCELPNDAARRVALGSLPPDLNSTYERILERVNQGSAETQKLVRRALRWIANDDRHSPLTVEALCEAVSIDLGSTRLNREAIPDEFEILHRCSSLVRKSENGKKLELAHFTVKEFLQQIDPKRDISTAAYRYDLGNDKLIIAKVCLTYLMFEDFDQGGPFSPAVVKRRHLENPFREYAVFMGDWDADKYSDETDCFALICKFFDPSKHSTFISWAQDLISITNFRFDAQALSITNSGLAEATPLHYAAMLGFPKVCDWLIGRGCDVNRNTKFGTPLHCALLDYHAFYGKFSNALIRSAKADMVKTVEVLLGAGADPNCYYRSDIRTLSPLFVALYMVNFDTAVQLLDRGAILDSDCLGLLEDGPGFGRLSSEKIYDLIGHITEGNVRQEDNTRLIKLALRSEASHATLLMQPNNDVPSQSLQYDHDLRTAAEYGQVEMVINLLEAQKLDVNVADGDTGLTALHHAAMTDQLGVAQVLLDRGADLSQVDNQRRTALHHCILSGETHCLQLFLQMDTNTSDRDLEGMTVWHLAAQEGNVQALSVLLSLQVDPRSVADLKAIDGRTPLLCASASWSKGAMELLLNAGSSLSNRASDGSSPLHYAAKSGSLESVEYLVEQKVPLNLVTHEGSTALHIAAESKDDSVLEYLLNENLMSNIDARTERGETPLSVSVWAENPRSVSLLLSKGADTTIVDEHGYSAIHWAAKQGSEEVIAEFIQYGSDLGLPDSRGLTPELVAREYGHETLARTIMNYVNEKDKDDESNTLTHSQTSSQLNARSEALKVAIDIGDIELCTRLIESGTDLGAEFDGCSGCTPLLYSLEVGQFSISKYLVSQGCSIRGNACAKCETTDFSALHYAAASGDNELLDLLLEKSPSEIFLNRDPIHPIHLAVLLNNAECVKTILDHVSQGKGRSPSDQLGTLQEPLGRILNVQVRDHDFVWKWYDEQFPREFMTARPLHIAASIGNLQIGSILLAHGASVNSVDGQYATPLHNAAYHGLIAMVKLLLEAGANLHALDWNLQSPAMIAAQQGHVNCVRVLLEAGADIKLRDSWGQTALHLAAEYGAKDMFIFLMSKVSVYELAIENTWGRSILYSAMRESLAFPMSFLLSLAPPAAAYMSHNRNILNAAILNRSAIDIKMLLRRIPAYLLPRLLNQREPWRGTPLHKAAIDEKVDIMTLLLDTGAQLEIEACHHGTALMGACAIGRLASVKFLVAKGARTSYMQDGKVYSALLVAKYHPEVRRWLLVGRFLEGPRLLTHKAVEGVK